MTRRLAIGLLAMAAIALCALSDTAPVIDTGGAELGNESTLIATVEIESGRSATTRIWENVYLEPVLDIDGNPTGEVEERREQYTEIATGLCYDAAGSGEAPDWQPTVTDFVRTGDSAYPFEVTTGPLQVRLSNDPTWGSHVQVTANGEAITLGVAGLVVQDPDTGATTLLEEAHRVEPIVEGNRILFPGAFSCGDLEYVYHRHGFEQNLIITSRRGLPQEGLIGLASTLDTSASAPRLSIQSDVAAARRHSSQLAAAAGQPPQRRQSQSDGGSAVNLSARLSGGEVVQAEETPLAFVNADNLPVMHFAQGQAWDAAGRSGRNAVDVRQSVLQRDNRPLLVDAVDASWLGEAELPVTVDYIIEMSGGQVPKNVLFERGITYHISDIYIVGNGETLAVEPGAVIKIDGGVMGIQINTGGTLRMAGQEFDPIVVTCADDSDVGALIPGATAGIFDMALWFNNGTLGTIQWTKFGNGSAGIYFSGNLASFDPIAHCVFRDISNALVFEGASGPLTVFNCLIANAEPDGASNSGTGVLCWSDAIDLTVTSCTFHGYTNGIHLENYGNAELTVSNTLFTAADAGTVYGVRYLDYGSGYGGSSVHHCAFQSTVDTPVTTLPTSNITILPSNPYVNSDEFYTGQLVYDFLSYFLYSPLADQGTASAGLEAMTVFRPIPIDSTNINSTSSDHIATWAPRTSGLDIRDGSGDDIGYHYPRVDFLIDVNSNLYLDRELPISEGTRLAFDGTNAAVGLILNTSGSEINFNGTPSNPVEIFSFNACNSQIDNPAWGDYSGIFIFAGAPRNSVINNLRMRHAGYGIWARGDQLYHPIENCQFIDCGRAIDFENLRDGDVTNCLFHRCGDGIFLNPNQYTPQHHDHSIEGNTFSQCIVGVHSYASSSAEATDSSFTLVLEDNLFQQCEVAIYAHHFIMDLDDINIIDRNNSWYANRINVSDETVAGTFSGADGIDPSATDRFHVTDNPLTAHLNGRLRSAGQFALQRWERPSEATLADDDFFHFGDGLFLAQNSNDVSRWPYEVPWGAAITSVSLHDIYSDDLINLLIGVSDPSEIPQIPGTAYLHIAEIPSAGPAVHTSYPAHTEDGRLWISLGDHGYASNWSTGSDPHIDITFSTGDELSVRIPPNIDTTSMTDRIVFWVASDGSTYWGQSSHAPGNANFDQCSGYAMAVDPGGLAQGAFAATSTASPLFDQGSRDLWNDGTNSTSLSGGVFDEPDNPSSAVVHESNPEDIMDIGYHYRGDLRHPSASLENEYADYWSTGQNLILRHADPDTVVLLSREIDSSDTRLGETIAYLLAEMYFPPNSNGDDGILPIMAWDFEAGTLDSVTLHAMPPISTGEPGLRDRDRGSFSYVVSDPAGITWVLMTGTVTTNAVGSSNWSASVGGVQFLATVVHWADPYVEALFDELYIWRSTDGGDNWYLIAARLHPYISDMNEWDYDDVWIRDVALATNNEDLWVFWNEMDRDTENGNYVSGLYGAFLDNATNTNPSTDPIDPGIAGGVFDASTVGLAGDVIDLTGRYSSVSEICQLRTSATATLTQRGSLDAVFDFAYPDASNDGVPVITYLDQNGDACAARIDLDTTGEILGFLGPIENLADSIPHCTLGDSHSLALAVNNMAVSYPATGETFSIESVFIHRDATTGGTPGAHEGTWRCGASTAGTADTWNDAEHVPFSIEEMESQIDDERRFVDVTTRFDGRPRQAICTMDTDFDRYLVTSTDIVSLSGDAEPRVHAITTNALNLTDIWTIHDITTVHKLIITRLAP